MFASKCNFPKTLKEHTETEIVMEGVTTILQGDPDHYQDLSPLGVTGQ